MVLKRFSDSIASNSNPWFLLPLTVFLAILWRNHTSLPLYHQIYHPALEYARYQNSAYFQGDKADYILSDEQVNVIRGVEQLVFKKDPTESLPGHPFAASYLYAISITFFNNPYYASLFAVITIVFVIYRLVGHLTQDPRSPHLVAALFLLDPLLNEALFTTMLDIFLLLFLLLSLHFLLEFRATGSSAKILLSSLFLGLALSSKFYPATLPFLGAVILSTLLTKDFTLFKKHLFSLPALFLGFLIGHLTFFAHRLDPLDFVRYQRFIQNWWAGSPNVPPFAVFSLIFQNQWATWWGTQTVVSLSYWSPLWGVALLYSITLLKKRHLPYTNLFILWIILSLAMFSFMAVYPRHLLTLLPALYLTPFYTKNRPT